MISIATLFLATILVVFLSTACGDGSPTAPKPVALPPAVQPPTPVPGGFASLVGTWNGLSTVESMTGVAPSCIAPFWGPTSTDALSVEIHPFQDGSRLDMVLHQRASEQCHVQLAQSQSQVTGAPWPYDEFDCALVPSLCGLGCHFRLESSQWSCERTPPEVWILGVALTGTIGDESPDRMQGAMEIGYDHRPGNYPTLAGGYSRVSFVTRFDIRKVSR